MWNDNWSVHEFYITCHLWLQEKKPPTANRRSLTWASPIADTTEGWTLPGVTSNHGNTWVHQAFVLGLDIVQRLWTLSKSCCRKYQIGHLTSQMTYLSFGFCSKHSYHNLYIFSEQTNTFPLNSHNTLKVMAFKTNSSVFHIKLIWTVVKFCK